MPSSHGPVHAVFVPSLAHVPVMQSVFALHGAPSPPATLAPGKQ